MPPILDGLLDAEEDLSILWLSLQDRHSQAVLTQQALVRPSTERISQPQASQTRCTAHQLDSLYVPHLRIPWAQTLQDLLFTQLNIRVIPPQSSPDVVMQVPTIIQTLLNHRPSQPSTQWHDLVSSFYPPLPHSAVAHNVRILNRIRVNYPARILYRLAVAARLATTSVLLASFARASLRSAATLNISHTVRHRTSTRANGITIVARSIPHCPSIVAPNSPSTPNSSGPSVLLHNVVLKRALLPGVSDALERRYAVQVIPDRSHSYSYLRGVDRLRGSLLSLANSGTALVDLSHYNYHEIGPVTTGDAQCERVTTAQRERRGSMQKTGVHTPERVDVDAYFREMHGTTWMDALKWATSEAMKSTNLVVSNERTRIEMAIERSREIRDELVNKALSLEIAEGPLYKICAFTMVQQLDKHELDNLRNLGCEYQSSLDNAQWRVESLKSTTNVGQGVCSVAALVIQ